MAEVDNCPGCLGLRQWWLTDSLCDVCKCGVADALMFAGGRTDVVVTSPGQRNLLRAAAFVELEEQLGKMDPEQRRHFAGLSLDTVRYLVIWGTEDRQVLHGLTNMCSHDCWYEVTLAPKWVEAKIWRLKLTTSMLPNGQEIRLHAAMVPNGTAHEGSPDYTHREHYDLDGYAGTRLAVHAAQWYLSDAPGVAEA